MAKQAVLIVHGMGEQRPLDTLTRFVRAALPPDADGEPGFYSRPETVTGSYESRRFLAPKVPGRPQTEFFEYHWADRMQGNRIDDLWPTFRRMVLCSPRKVPAGLRGVWVLAWALILAAAWAMAWGPLQDVWRSDQGAVAASIGALASGGLVAVVLSYVASRLLPAWLTASFVDVVRYLDTSPRSYGVRRDVRRGLIEMLQTLRDTPGHDGEPAYERVVVVAHSLGGFIAYDAITHVWGTFNHRATTCPSGGVLAGRAELAAAADDLLAGALDARGYQ